jgi:hypothetical protein
MEKELLTVMEVRKIIKVCEAKIYQLFKEGRLTRIKVSGRNYIPRLDVNRYIGEEYKYTPEDWAKISQHLPPL